MSARQLSAAALALLLAGCATGPAPPGAQVEAARVEQAVVIGQSTRDSVRAALGPTRSVVFDSGYETWLYQLPLGGGSYGELVILFDRATVDFRQVKERDGWSAGLRLLVTRAMSWSHPRRKD